MRRPESGLDMAAGSGTIEQPGSESGSTLRACSPGPGTLPAIGYLAKYLGVGEAERIVTATMADFAKALDSVVIPRYPGGGDNAARVER
jgi:hypothetical protein